MRRSGSSEGSSASSRKTRYLNCPSAAPSLGSPLNAGDPTSTTKLCREKGEFSKTILHGPLVIATHWTCSPLFKRRLLRESGSCTRPFSLIRIGNVLNCSAAAGILCSVLSLLIAAEEILKPPIPPQVIEIRKVANCCDRVACFHGFFQPLESLIDFFKVIMDKRCFESHG